MILGSEKVIFLPDLSTLLIADLHLGKVAHFRKAGIGIPFESYKEDYRSLNDVLINYSPNKIVIVGDLFHSTYNNDWENFIEFLSVFSEKQFILVKGNHDIMSDVRYASPNLSLVETYILGDLIITHEPMVEIQEKKYNLYGHLHPGVRIKGRSKQSLRLPCFYFENNFGIMPAFGRFTGLALQNPNVDTEVFIIAEEKVISLK
jgi:DNA ligase-associated metallophosphoesterase